MKFRKFRRTLRRFFRRFNPWLYLVCLLLAVIIWCAAMYSKDPDGLREEVEDSATVLILDAVTTV